MEAPEISVVIASHNAAAVIAECLTALQAQARREAAEVIVADSSSDETPDIVRERFPDVRLLHFSEPLSVPRLRGYGMAAARGEIIAIIDPYSIVDDHWLAELVKAHAERPGPAIGGAVELYRAEEQGLIAWATYLYEYGGFILPLIAGPTPVLPGSNISYKRWALPLRDVEKLKREGFWKTFINWQLEHLWLAPSVVVRLWKPIPFMEFFRSRYDHGRCFAAMRVAGSPWRERWLRGLTAPLLPALFLWRLARDYWPRRRYRAKFAVAAPLMFLLFGNWAWGELWGYLRGPGRSCTRLFY